MMSSTNWQSILDAWLQANIRVSSRASTPASRPTLSRQSTRKTPPGALGEEVDEHNVMLHLGIVEQKVNEILQQ